MEGSNLLSEAKRPTTPDVTSGVLAAIEAVLPAEKERANVQGVTVPLPKPRTSGQLGSVEPGFGPRVPMPQVTLVEDGASLHPGR